MREIVHLQTGQCGNQIGTKVGGDLQVFVRVRSRDGHVEQETWAAGGVTPQCARLAAPPLCM